MGTATRLDVPVRDLDDAQLRAGNGPSLVQPEAVPALRLLAGDEFRRHLPVREHDVVRERLDSGDLLVRQAVVVRDVEPREVLRLVRARLPHVVPEHLARGAERDVRGGVVAHEPVAALRIDLAGHPFPDGERRRGHRQEVDD